MKNKKIYLDLKIGFPDGKVIDFLECSDRFVEMESQVEKGSEKEKLLKNNLKALGITPLF